MPKIADYPLSATFAGLATMQAMGQIVAGNAAPNGIGDALTIRDGVMVARVRDSDPMTALGRRAEITAPPDAREERWYTWDFMVPEHDISHPFSVMQIHDTPDGGDTDRYPNFLVTIEAGQIVISVPRAVLPTQDGFGRRIAIADLEFGRWYSCALHVKWSIDNSGFREFFLDQVPYLRESGIATHYDDAVGPYLKLGVYNFYGSYPPSGFDHTAHFRNAAVWSGNDGYSGVMGGVPMAPVSMLLP